VLLAGFRLLDVLDRGQAALHLPIFVMPDHVVLEEVPMLLEQGELAAVVQEVEGVLGPVLALLGLVSGLGLRGAVTSVRQENF